MRNDIETMYRLFGKSPGNYCKECNHFTGNPGSYHKCECYGKSASEATDWNVYNIACGLFNNPYSGSPVINYKKHSGRKKLEEQIEGQMSLSEMREECQNTVLR